MLLSKVNSINNPQDFPFVADQLTAVASEHLVELAGDCALQPPLELLVIFKQLSPVDTQSKILAILNTPGLEVAEADLLLQAITWHVEKNVDFIDAYNAAWMVTQGLTTIFTHDRKHFSRFDRLTVVEPGK